MSRGAKRKLNEELESSVVLSEEQEAALSVCLAGNAFLTGGAGTGKTEVARKIILGLQARYGSDAVAVLASTGIAATPLGGATFDSFFNLLRNEEDLPRKKRLELAQMRAHVRLTAVHAVFCDEISMLAGETLDFADALLRRVKRVDEPFGGVHVVVCGDPYQLGPVKKEPFFTAGVWDEAFHTQAVLRVSQRALGDVRLQYVLLCMRANKFTELALRLIDELAAPLDERGVPGPYNYVETHRDEVQARNAAEMSGAPDAETRVYVATDRGAAAFPAEARIRLRVGAPVVLVATVNAKAGLRNGACGVVTAMGGAGVTVRFEHGVFDVGFVEMRVGAAVRSQIPLALAYALTVHKAQGMSLQKVDFNMGRIFEPGQGYTGASRARSFDTLRLRNFRQSAFVPNLAVLRKFPIRGLEQDLALLAEKIGEQ